MPLLHFLGVTSIKRHFSAAFCFLPDEKDPSYIWALDQFDHFILGDSLFRPKVVLTDNEKALKNGLTKVIGEIPQLLYYWHVNNNVLVEAQKVWKVTGSPEEIEANKELRDEFMARWRKVNWAKTEA
jgi:hypothetical protein